MKQLLILAGMCMAASVIAPVVVMADGIGGTKAGGLAPFAERFPRRGVRCHRARLSQPRWFWRTAARSGVTAIPAKVSGYPSRRRKADRNSEMVPAQFPR